MKETANQTPRGIEVLPPRIFLQCPYAPHGTCLVYEEKIYTHDHPGNESANVNSVN